MFFGAEVYASIACEKIQIKCFWGEIEIKQQNELIFLIVLRASGLKATSSEA